MTVRLAVIGAACGALLCAQAPVRSPCVVDEGPRDPSFVRFRTELLAATVNRSFERLRPLLAPDVDTSEVGGLERSVGPEAFRDKHRLHDRGSPSWTALEQLVSFGGRFSDSGVFCAPYYSCPSPSADLDDVVVTGTDVPVYSEPSAASALITRLSCTVIKAASAESLNNVPVGADWFGVILNSGKVGFIPSGSFVWPDMFIVSGRSMGQWRVQSFKAVD